MMISCQLSLYPLGTKEYNKTIVDSLNTIKSLKQQGLTIEIGSMSTILKGPDDVVWKGVQMLFDKAIENNRKIVLSVLCSNDCGYDT
ncbi:MAG: YkoF family thiamine/hydroxymethylpyrimidine-binding protein [Petrotogales bacterium]